MIEHRLFVRQRHQSETELLPEQELAQFDFALGRDRVYRGWYVAQDVSRRRRVERHKPPTLDA